MPIRPAVIFDFDGTIALGDGPVRAYARAVEEIAGVSGIEAVLDAPAGDVLDGYDAVRVAAEAQGVSGDDLSAAYLASRGVLATPEAPIAVPDGLASFLSDAGEAGALRVLVTNAPDIRITEALDALGLTGGFDRIVTSAQKPAGFDQILDTLNEDGITAMLSIGDVWRNDLAPVQARGHATALVGDYPDQGTSPDHRAATLSALLPELRAWLAAHAPTSAS